MYSPVKNSNTKSNHTRQISSPPQQNLWNRVNGGMAVFLPQLSLPPLPTPSKKPATQTVQQTPSTDSNTEKLSITDQGLSKLDQESTPKSHLDLHTVVNLPKQKINIKNQFITKVNSDQSRLHSHHHALAMPQLGTPLPLPIPTPPSKLQAKPKTSIAKDINEHHPPSKNPIDKQSLINKRISQHIDNYTQSMDFLNQVAKRAKPYLHPVIDTLSKNKLPAELALLPIVESSYQPKANSSKKAAGLWQFIPETGQDYNLIQNDSYDERFDILASTQAAASFLTDLKRHYNGDWLLALAAYNCGATTVDNAINKNKTEGLETDYWSLALPEETQNYVPKFLALTEVFSHPESYGLKLDLVRNEPSLIKITLNNPNEITYLASKSLMDIAQLADLDYTFFTNLNAAHIQAHLPKTDALSLVLPLSNANHLHQNLAKTSSATVIKQFYLIPPHPSTDWFLSTDTNFTSSLYLSLDINNPHDRISKTQILYKNPIQPAIMDMMPHYVDTHETITTIARRYGIKAETLCANNHIKPKQKLSWGQKLLIPKPTG